MHQAKIHHAHLIDDENLAVEGIGLIPLKMPSPSSLSALLILRSPLILEQAVNRLRLPARGLAHPLRRSPGRRREGDRLSLH